MTTRRRTLRIATTTAGFAGVLVASTPAQTLPQGGAAPPHRADAVRPGAFVAGGHTATAPAGPAPDAGRYDALIERLAARAGIRTALVRAVVEVESDFDPDAFSPDGAMGLMQLMPETAAELGVVDAFDPEENVRAGVRYLRQLLDAYDGEETLALAAYNAGPGTVERYGHRVPPYPETRRYVDRVLARAGVPPGDPTDPGLLTIYRVARRERGRVVIVYTNVPPAFGAYEVVWQP